MYSKPFRCRWSSVTGTRSLSAAASASSVMIENEEATSMNTTSLMPLRSAILRMKCLRAHVTCFHACAPWCDSDGCWLRFSSSERAMSSSDESPHSRYRLRDSCGLNFDTLRRNVRGSIRFDVGLFNKHCFSL